MSEWDDDFTPDLDFSALQFKPVPAEFCDTAGWQPKPDGSGWTDPRTGAAIALKVGGELTEPYWLADFDLARGKLARDYGAIGCLVEAVPITVGGVRGMVQLMKARDTRRERGSVVVGMVFLAKVGSTVTLTCMAAEGSTTGVRETFVALRQGTVLDRPVHPYDPEVQSQLPYLESDEAVWDEHFPDHPLSVVRTWIRSLDRRVRVSPAFAALPEFRGTSRL